MLPKELEDIFSEFDEDDFNLHVTRADFSGENLIIDFSLTVQDINKGGGISQKWIIEAAGYKKSHISFDLADSMELKDDHPLLWEFTDIQCQLYFTGQCKDPARLFYELYSIHKSLFRKHQCFNISFGEGTSYFRLFQYSNGLLAQGSKKLMEKYADCLKQNGLDFSIIGERPAKYWDGNQFTSEDKNLKVLLLS